MYTNNFGNFNRDIYNTLGEEETFHSNYRLNYSDDQYRNPRFNAYNLYPSITPTDLAQTDMPLYAGLRIPFQMICYPLIVYQLNHPIEEDEIKSMEYSNKIIAPDTILQKLCQYGNIQSEYVFQINKGNNRVTIGKYYTYDSNIDDNNNIIYVPQYIFEGLNIEYGGVVDFSFINEPIPKGEYIRLQPLTNKIMKIDNYQIYLQEHLQKNYTCLIKGESIKIPYYDDMIVMIIHDVSPTNIVSITDTDLAVDFEPSIEQKDIEAQQETLLKEEKEKEERIKIEKQLIEQKRIEADKITTQPNNNITSMRFNRLPLTDVDKDNDKDKATLEPNTFIAFEGTGHVSGTVKKTLGGNNGQNVKDLETMRQKRLKFLDTRIQIKQPSEQIKQSKNTVLNTPSKQDTINLDNIIIKNPSLIDETKNTKPIKPKFKFKLKLKKTKTNKLDTTKLVNQNNNLDTNPDPDPDIIVESS